MVDREAPAREPRVVERTATPDGVVNTVVELPAVADAYIASEWPNQNFGADALYVGYHLIGDDNFGAERTLLRFDVLDNVPRGAVINEARVELHLNYSSPSDDEPMPTIVRRLGSAWSEMDVTWSREPQWEEIRAEASVGSEIAWYDWDVTGLVSDWVARTHPNYGLEIIGDERVQQRERAFYSRETTNQLYPRLIIDYTAFNDTQPPEVTVNDLPRYVSRDFTVSWSGKDPGGSGIASYDVQYRVDGGDWATWIVDTTASSAAFAGGLDGRFYEFRARGEDRAGNVEPWGPAEASTTVDAEPPSTTVDPLPDHTTQSAFEVSWTGEDDGSGIHYYDVRYRFGDGNWVPWQRQTLATSATFQAQTDGRYAFEARAVDNFGLAEDFTGEAEATIVVDTEPPRAVVNRLPASTSDTAFTVSWSGSDAVAGIAYYDVRYRVNHGEWILWLSETLATSARFTADAGDGVYEFEARAVDRFGLVEPFRGRAEAGILVDAEPPFVVPQLRLPLVVRDIVRQ
jgi:hypothetical protein